jgi:anthranilate synthase component 2
MMSKIPNILLLDNYDSFTHNLQHYLEYDNDCLVTVKRNDEIDLSEVEDFDALLLSPGPGLPRQSGKMMEIIERYHTSKKMLGVCLGHQAIAEFFGAQLTNSPNVFHGIATNIFIKKADYLYANLPNQFKVSRYHSWFVSNNHLPDVIDVTANDENEMIMSIQHRELPIYGVQFHPESILSENGLQIIRNWKLL